MLGDMGPDSDILPKPLKIIPDKSVYLINPGENFSDKPFFMKLSFDGNIQVNVNLKEVLEINDSAFFVVEDLFIYPDDKTCLLYGNSYDPKTNLYFDHEAAFFDQKGKLLKKLILPKNTDLSSWNILVDGRFWAYSKDARAWTLFSPDGEALHSTKATFNGTVLSEGSLLCEFSDSNMILCDTAGKTTLVSLTNKVISADFFARGFGNFIGILTSGLDTKIDNFIKTNIMLQTIYYDSSKSKIYFLPSLNLDPHVFTLNDIPVEWYDFSSVTFDGSGNFYSVARSGGKKPSLTIYKMDIDEEIVKKITEDK
jgi:hypothetical protein